MKYVHMEWSKRALYDWRWRRSWASGRNASELLGGVGSRKASESGGGPINGIRFGNHFFAFTAFAFASDQERKIGTPRVRKEEKERTAMLEQICRSFEHTLCVCVCMWVAECESLWLFTLGKTSPLVVKWAKGVGAGAVDFMGRDTHIHMQSIMLLSKQWEENFIYIYMCVCIDKQCQLGEIVNCLAFAALGPVLDVCVCRYVIVCVRQRAPFFIIFWINTHT